MAAVKNKEKEDVEEFGAKILAVAYAAVYKLQKWQTTILEKKKNLKKKQNNQNEEDHFTMNYLLDMNTLSLFLKMTLTNLTYLSLPLKNQTPPSPKCYFSVSFLSLSNP